MSKMYLLLVYTRLFPFIDVSSSLGWRKKDNVADMLTKITKLCEHGGARAVFFRAAEVPGLREKIDTLTGEVGGKDLQLLTVPAVVQVHKLLRYEAAQLCTTVSEVNRNFDDE